MTIPKTLVILGLLIFVSFAGFLAGGYFWYCEVSLPPEKTPDGVQVNVSPGASLREIAYLLKSRKVIRSAFLFRFFVGMYGVSQRLKPGNYQFPGGESLEMVIQTLMKGREERVRLTIPEGWTVPDIANAVERAGLCPAASFSEAVGSREILGKIFKGWGEIPSAEGLVFPETYSFSKGSPPHEIVETMLRFTRDKVDRIAEQLPAVSLTKYQACILASIVEREAKKAEDRPLVASVFHNRLRKGMKLESCATVQYSLPEHKERLLLEDLKIQSPFNTYINVGLPPTPISNFGEASLVAVASPAASDFLFFVSDAAEGHRFSATLGEHERSKQQFFRDRKKAKRGQ